MVVVTTALAHGGDSRVDLGSGTVRAGGTVEVRLVAVAPGDAFRIDLVAPGQSAVTTWSQRLIADADGGARGTFDLPADIVPGEYLIRAVAVDGHAVATSLLVQGSVEERGDPGAREEDDPLLVALPSGWQRSLSVPVATGTTAAPPRAGGWIDGSFAVLLGGIGLVLLAKFGVRAHHARSDGSGAGSPPRGDLP